MRIRYTVSMGLSRIWRVGVKSTMVHYNKGDEVERLIRALDAAVP